MTLMQAVAAGGGATPRGTLKGIKVTRHGVDGKVEMIEPTMEDTLKDGDVVFVREIVLTAGAGSANLAHFLAVLRRARWVSAVVVFATVLLVAILYLVFATRVYTATASLLIDAKPDPVSSMLYGGAMPALINTQTEILRSDAHSVWCRT